MTIRYAAGNEHSPMDRAGRVTLELDADGALRVRHHAWLTGQVRTWSTRVEPAVTRDIIAALPEARSPDRPDVYPPPDGRTRMLHTSGTGTVILPWDAALTVPGYAEVFERLDALIVAVMSEPTGQPPAEDAGAGASTGTAFTG